MATSAAAVGIGPSPSRALRSSGGMPRSTQRRLFDCATPASRSGMRAACLGQDLLGFLDVAPGGRTLAQTIFRNTQRFLLYAHVLASEDQPRLKRPQLHIGRGDVRKEDDEDVVVVIDGGVEIGAGGLDGAAEAAPEIDLPRRLEAAVPFLDPDFGRHIRGFLAELAAHEVPARLLQLREEIADRDAAQAP